MDIFTIIFFIALVFLVLGIMVLFIERIKKYLSKYSQKGIDKYRDEIYKRFNTFKKYIETELNLSCEIYDKFNSYGSLVLDIRDPENENIKKIIITSAPYKPYKMELFLNINISREVYGILTVELDKRIIRDKTILSSSDFKTEDVDIDNLFHVRDTGRDNLISLFSFDLRKLYLHMAEIFDDFDFGNSIMRAHGRFDPSKLDSGKLVSIIDFLLKLRENLSSLQPPLRRSIDSLKSEKNIHVILKIIEYLKNEELSSKDIEEIKFLLFHDNTIVQINAASIAGETGYNHAFTMLSNISMNNEKEIKLLVPIILKKKNKESVDLLLKRYKDIKNFKIKSYFFEIFREISMKEMVDFLRCEILTTSADVYIAAIETLGDVGGKEEVIFLDEFNQIKKNADIQWVVSQAISSIQSRLTGVESGMVSMQETEKKEGLLSIEDSHDGKLSLKETGGGDN